MTLSHHDLLLVQRHVDGALDAAADVAFRARLAAEPELARRAAEQRSASDLLRAARGAERRPSPGFTAGLLAAVRQLPTRQQLEQADHVAGAVAWCRRILLAAVVLAALGVVWQSGLVRREAAGVMEADSAAVQREIERLDAEVRAGRVPPPASGPRAGR